MSIKSKISNSVFGTWLRIWRNFGRESREWKTWAYDCQMEKDKVKIKTDLQIRVHSIEKGMSIGETKQGFGRNKVLSILEDLDKYITKFNNFEFSSEVCDVINQYILFNNLLDDDEIVLKFKKFCLIHSIKLKNEGGVFTKSKDSVIECLKGDFNLLSQNRYAIRDFGKKHVDIEQIERALKLAEKTPSACNRQPWRIYVFSGKLKDKMLELQKGSRGFWDDIQYAILICGEIRCYNTEETNLLYVDGGLYGMNLMYALSYVGLATIPLTMGRRQSDLISIKNAMDIPQNEEPVLVIGVGSFKDEMKVAVSKRYSYKEYTKIK